MPKNKTTSSTALIPWDQKLAAMAKEAKQAVAGFGGGGNFLSLKGGNIAYQGAVIPDKKIKVIVVDWILENQHYAGEFDPENFSAPDCYAFGKLKRDMAPDPEQVVEPVSEACTGCPNLEWGSAVKGRGKACAEVARLGLITEADLDNIEKAEIAYLKVPVTSTKYWAGYVRQLEENYHKPALAFITEIAVVPQAALPGWHVEFSLVEEIKADPETYDLLWKRYEEVSKAIAFPYAKNEEVPEKPQQRGRTNGKAPVPARAVAPRRAAPVAPIAAVSATTVSARRAVKQPKY